MMKISNEPYLNRPAACLSSESPHWPTKYMMAKEIARMHRNPMKNLKKFRSNGLTMAFYIP